MNIEKNSEGKKQTATAWVAVVILSLAILIGFLSVERNLLGRQEQPQSPSTHSREKLENLVKSLRGLSGNEGEVLAVILSDKNWSEERPGDAELIEMLTAISMRDNDPEEVHHLLSLIEDKAQQPGWKRLAFLRGIEQALADTTKGNESGASGGAHPSVLSPELFSSLSQSSDREVAGYASLIRDRLQGSRVSSDAQEPIRPLTEEEQRRFEVGEREFKAICAGCHLESGKGMAGFAPPLVNSTWVNGPPKFLAMIVLQGKEGTPGYPSMPPLRGLNDERIAAILTYIRREWGHQASPVSPSLVTEVRKATEGRAQAWRERELEKLLKEGSSR